MPPPDGECRDARRERRTWQRAGKGSSFSAFNFYDFSGYKILILELTFVAVVFTTSTSPRLSQCPTASLALTNAACKRYVSPSDPSPTNSLAPHFVLIQSRLFRNGFPNGRRVFQGAAHTHADRIHFFSEYVALKLLYQNRSTTKIFQFQSHRLRDHLGRSVPIS